MVVVITDRLTTGQLTFILRVIVQVLAYGGIFLLGLLVLGHSPRVGTLETHDVLNRVVGKSTATFHTLGWIRRRLFTRNRDPSPTTLLLLALLLSLVYGIFVSVTDVGYIGLEHCTVAGGTYQDFPASVNSETAARSIMERTLFPKTDPAEVNYHQCDASEEVHFGDDVNLLVCKQWTNTTYADSAKFRTYNMTDTASLMNPFLSRIPHNRTDSVDLNTYLAGAPSNTIKGKNFRDGIAVIAQKAGAQLVVGVPDMAPLQKVTIPKTMAVEIDVGCLSLGVSSKEHPEGVITQKRDIFLPDPLYLPWRETRYVGIEALRKPLEKAADGFRALLRPAFNESVTNNYGYWFSFNESSATFRWQTAVNPWFPPIVNGISNAEAGRFLLWNCSIDTSDAVGASIPGESITGTIKAQSCATFALQGSYIDDNGFLFRGVEPMVCATATSINMVSAELETNDQGIVNASLTYLPSDLHITRASYYDIIHDKPLPGDRVFSMFGPLQRFALSDNPSGETRHYIYQFNALGSASAEMTSGVGSAGHELARAGSAILSVSTLDSDGLLTINPDYLSVNNFSASVMTKWMGGVGSSFLFHSISYNGFSALDKEAVSVETTDGKAAVCYRPLYGIAFLPLLLAALIIFLWTLQMLVSGGLRGTRRLEKMYGGLGPSIVTPHPEKPGPEAVLGWEDNGDQPHLRPVYSSVPPHPGMPKPYSSEYEMSSEPHHKTEYSG